MGTATIANTEVTDRAAVVVSWRHGLECAIVYAFTSHMTDSEQQLHVMQLLSALPDEQRESLLAGLRAASDGNDEAALFDLARLASQQITATLRDAFGGGSR